MPKQEIIKNASDQELDAVDRKYLQYMPIPLDGAAQNVASALRSRDIQAIEVSLKPIANIASNFMLILGMACLVIDRERLYEGTEFGWSYLRYADHLVEELNIPIATLSEAKVNMEIFVDNYKSLEKAGFQIYKNTSKLRYLPEAIENHGEEEAYKRIVEYGFIKFRDWAQKKHIAHRALPGPDTRVDVVIDGNKILISGKNILNFPKGIDDEIKAMVAGDLGKTFSIRETGNVPFIIETYDTGEQTAIANFLKKYRAKK
jgi:hypothetical protein